MYLARFEGHSRAVDEIRMEDYAREHPLLSNAAVHAQWKRGSWQVSRIGEIWKRTGKIFSVPYEGTNAYPAFQFGADGTPLALVEQVLRVLPTGANPWQQAFWMTSPNLYLDGTSPADCIQAGDDRVVLAASHAVFTVQ